MTRRSIAVLCLASLLFAVAIPVAAVLVVLPEEYGIVFASLPDSNSRALTVESIPRHVLRVLTSSGHLARAALPARF